jgi:hypothetical protein
MNTPCHGHTALFDSTDQPDHARAQNMCLGLRRPDGSQITKPCPFLAGCKKLLDDTLETYGKGGPRGTWAGILVDAAEIRADATHDRSAERIAAEEAAYTVETARKARARRRAAEKDAA